MSVLIWCTYVMRSVASDTLGVEEVGPAAVPFIFSLLAGYTLMLSAAGGLVGGMVGLIVGAVAEVLRCRPAEDPASCGC
jgi:hypothetical protein